MPEAELGVQGRGPVEIAVEAEMDRRGRPEPVDAGEGEVDLLDDLGAQRVGGAGQIDAAVAVSQVLAGEGGGVERVVAELHRHRAGRGGGARPESGQEHRCPPASCAHERTLPGRGADGDGGGPSECGRRRAPGVPTGGLEPAERGGKVAPA